MFKNMNPLDSVRASRDGHEFHEAWTARKTLQLLFPTDKLVGIAIEGLHPSDQTKAISATVQIADTVLYYGKGASFESADSIHIVQFKYSVSNDAVEYRCSDAKETIKKFATSYLDHKKKYGTEAVKQKLQFQLITNRPIYPAFEQAIVYIAEKIPTAGNIKRQADQFKVASGLSEKTLIEFARIFKIIGFAGSLSGIKKDVTRTLVDWSAACDLMAKARLGGLKQLIRDKAGSVGTGRNVIRIIDVLTALEINEEKDLLPCPTAFPEVGAIVEREQLKETIALLSGLTKPLLIHSAGGMGKTVFLTSLAKAISKQHEIILFDCFGGGSYRAPDDSRHLPKRGLVHIANLLACQGLCDPLLPSNNDPDGLIRAFRRRLTQAVETLKRVSVDKKLVLFIDAIDNAAEHARDQHETSFPKLFLESINSAPIPGVKLIVSCRSHRIDISKGDVECIELRLNPFNLDETEIFLRNRLKKLSETEIQVAHARSGGNPRILEHLVSSDRGLLDPSEINNKIKLDDLLKDRIGKALSEARNRGYRKTDILAFLAGLSVLPPPVPLDEYAMASNMEMSAVESFAADLAPLLERTKYGLMFRDEPTETYIKLNYTADRQALRRVASNLLRRQDSSVYAARSLPGLLQRLEDGARLFRLAFDTRFPQSITSTIGKQNIRYERLKAAVLYAARKEDANQLVHLLVELSTIAAANNRGAEYVLDNPDLVILAQDVDATRRLFETRTNWPGTRHARLTIAHTLSGDHEEAYRHASRADEWIFHYMERDRDNHHMQETRPEQLDIASIPFCLITQNRSNNANYFLRTYKDWYSFEVAGHLFQLLQQQERSKPQSSILASYLKSLTSQIGVIASALSSVANIDNIQLEQLIERLSKACKKTNNIELNNGFSSRYHDLLHGLLQSSAIAVSIRRPSQALSIVNSAQIAQPGIWAFQDYFSEHHAFPFLIKAALISAIRRRASSGQDLIPKELEKICSRIKKTRNSSEFKEKLNKIIKDEALSYDSKQEAERFVNEKLESLLALTNALSKLLRTPRGKGDEAFLSFLSTWTEARKKRDFYIRADQTSRFFQTIGCQMAIFALRVRNDLKTKSIRSFIERLHEQTTHTNTLIEVVSILAGRSSLYELAGKEAIKAKSLIEQEDDVIQRASLFANLARAISAASNEEAAAYFKMGLEQMDSIGSGDYEFINELLIFASSLKGNNLNERDFHTLTNICELNMSGEAEKFPWFAFAKGLSKCSGIRGLAKISRWDDRSKISLDYTLLPYLTALIEDREIEPEDALVLLRLSNPVELYSCDTATFAKAINANKYADVKVLASELMEQFLINNPGLSMTDTIKTLSSFAESSIGKDSEISNYLSVAQGLFAKVRNENNNNINYRGEPDPNILRDNAQRKRDIEAKINKLATITLPNDEESISTAVDALNSMQYIYEFKDKFFEDVRQRLKFSERSKYIQIISQLENLDTFTKLSELKKCKDEWNRSSAGLAESFKRAGEVILHLDGDHCIGFGRLSGYRLQQISDLSGIPITTLSMELIKLFASPEWHVSAAVWLGLASIICEKSDPGKGQSALSRLLNSESAKLASNVADGEWKKGLYPSGDSKEIISGLIWRMLGSPHAGNRWRAAHSIRCLAKFNKWSILDALIEKMELKNAHPFQAPELPFYYLHARLWLLIAIARISIENPERIANYEEALKKIVRDDKSPHVLIRHFAQQAILSCAKSGFLILSGKERKEIVGINISKIPRLNEKLKKGQSGFYEGRPKGAPPKPEPNFHLDYDFEKYDVQHLSDIFGKPHWEVKDMLTRTIRDYDANIESMYDKGGREESRRDHLGMTSKHHTYGQYLGWHALFLVAGQLLSRNPVTADSYMEEPWPEWLNGYLLTREDGLWLSDGIDRTPLNTIVNLLEEDDHNLVITGEESKISNMIFVKGAIGKAVVVDGAWESNDKIDVRVSSSLVLTKQSEILAKRLLREEPLSVWLPSVSNYDNKKKGYIPWIINYHYEGRLDDDDPLGSINAIRRPQFSKDIVTTFQVHTDDPFSRIWKNSKGKPIAYSDAWWCSRKYGDESSRSGERLICSATLLREILKRKNADLIILVKLQRYQEKFGDRQSSFSHTVAVIRIKSDFEYEYFKGAINIIHENRN